MCSAPLNVQSTMWTHACKLFNKSVNMSNHIKRQQGAHTKCRSTALTVVYVVCTKNTHSKLFQHVGPPRMLPNWKIPSSSSSLEDKVKLLGKWKKIYPWVIHRSLHMKWFRYFTELRPFTSWHINWLMLVDFWVPKRSVTYVQRLEIVEIFTQWHVPNMSSYLSLQGQSTSLCHIQHHESLCNVAPIPYPLPACN